MTFIFTKSPLPEPLAFASAKAYTANTVERIPDDFVDRDGEWLIQQATGLSNTARPVFMLVHADDGVIWGRIEQGQLRKPDESGWTPPLRSLTVQQCRLFGDLGELFIWREAEGVWRGRKLMDVPGKDYALITERPYLIGDRVHDSTHGLSGSQLPQGFTPIIEIATGMRQIVPCIVIAGERGVIPQSQRPRLTVLHYLQEDEDGQSLIKCSRLKHVG